MRAEKSAVLLDHISGNSSNWSMIGGSTAAWAQRVFPDLPCEPAEVRLWKVIFDVCRVRAADPIAAWQQHIKSSHLALGAAYKFSIEGGTKMADEEFCKAGGNRSKIHVDFMVGSGEIDVDGVFSDGSAEPVMRGGEWAFDV